VTERTKEIAYARPSAAAARDNHLRISHRGCGANRAGRPLRQFRRWLLSLGARLVFPAIPPPPASGAVMGVAVSVACLFFGNLARGEAGAWTVEALRYEKARGARRESELPSSFQVRPAYGLPRRIADRRRVAILGATPAHSRLEKTWPSGSSRVPAQRQWLRLSLWHDRYKLRTSCLSRKVQQYRSELASSARDEFHFYGEALLELREESTSNEGLINGPCLL